MMTSKKAANDLGESLWDVLAELINRDLAVQPRSPASLNSPWIKERINKKLCDHLDPKTGKRAVELVIDGDASGALSRVWGTLQAECEQGWRRWWASRSPTSPYEEMPGTALPLFQIVDARNSVLEGPQGERLYRPVFSRSDAPQIAERDPIQKVKSNIAGSICTIIRRHLEAMPPGSFTESGEPCTWRAVRPRGGKKKSLFKELKQKYPNARPSWFETEWKPALDSLDRAGVDVTAWRKTGPSN